MTPRRRARVVTTAMVALLVPAACGGATDLLTVDEATSEPTSEATPSEPPSDDPTGSGPRGLEQFYAQQPGWQDCGDGFECTTVQVPIDYDDVGAGTVDLAVKQAPATSDSDRIGTLFLNPGGPGGSGVEYLDFFLSEAGSDLRAHYDVVGFDPRGVGSSDPVECLSDTELDTFIAYDPDPDTRAEVTRAARLVRQLGEGCVQNTGALAAHVSTIEVAKDLDVLRAVVGDDTLHYYGASYGTSIGATYAELFPDTVDRMVLDGALNPQLSIQELNLQQAEGFDTALRAYVADCVASGDCPLGSSETEVIGRIGDFLEGLDENPIQTSDPERPLTRSLGFLGILLPLYRQDSWTLLTQALPPAFDGDGSVLLTLADFYVEREDGAYLNNGTEVNFAVNCLDHPVDVGVAEIEASEPEYEQVSPVFGRVFAWSLLGCSNWPIAPTQEPLPIDAAGAAPILVVGTTRDPATPYQWSQALADQLDSGVLVSRDGDGHTGYHMGNECVDKAIDAYLIDGDVPDDGLEC